MPFQPSVYHSGPVAPRQLNTDYYGTPGGGLNGIAFHARRPVMSESLTTGGTAYSPLSAQPVAGAGVLAYTAADTTALHASGADRPGVYATFQFRNRVPGSSGAAAGGGFGGQWLAWCFPITAAVTVPPGGVGAGMCRNGSSFLFTGSFQYGGTTQNCPWYLDLLAAGTGTADLWQPGFWWLNPVVPTLPSPVTLDVSGPVTRMGWAWTAVSQGNAQQVASVPQPPLSWGTVTSALLNQAGSCLTFLNSPPVLRVSAGGQSIPNVTNTVIPFTSPPTADSYSGWSTATSAYTAPLPGLYLFSPALIWGTASSANDRWCGLQVTAGGTVSVYQGPAYKATLVGPGTTGTGLTGTPVVRVVNLNAGDTVSAYGFQNSGAALSLDTSQSSRLIAAYMSPVAPAGTAYTWSPPDPGFRWQAGQLSGAALQAAFQAHLGTDLAFLVNRPYFTGWQGTAQTGFADNSGFHQVTIDTLGALPRGGNGDSYAGWDPVNHRYAAQAAGWHLVITDLYVTPPVSGTAGVVTAGIHVSSSGGITPVNSPDSYQRVAYPVSTGGPPPGATAIGLYWLNPGEYVYPSLRTESWGGTWGTWTGNSTGGSAWSQLSVFFMSS